MTPARWRIAFAPVPITRCSDVGHRSRIIGASYNAARVCLSAHFALPLCRLPPTADMETLTTFWRHTLSTIFTFSPASTSMHAFSVLLLHVLLCGRSQHLFIGVDRTSDDSLPLSSDIRRGEQGQYPGIWTILLHRTNRTLQREKGDSGTSREGHEEDKKENSAITQPYLSGICRDV